MHDEEMVKQILARTRAYVEGQPSSGAVLVALVAHASACPFPELECNCVPEIELREVLPEGQA